MFLSMPEKPSETFNARQLMCSEDIIILDLHYTFLRYFVRKWRFV
jgi:hypothetical protein